MIDRDAACDLLQAIVACWLADARNDERELHRVACFLDVTPAEAQRMAQAMQRNEPTRTRRKKPAAERNTTYTTL